MYATSFAVHKTLFYEKLITPLPRIGMYIANSVHNSVHKRQSSCWLHQGPTWTPLKTPTFHLNNFNSKETLSSIGFRYSVGGIHF